MENFVNLITNGSTDFTPQVLISLIIVVLIIDCIGAIAGSMFHAVR